MTKSVTARPIIFEFKPNEVGQDPLYVGMVITRSSNERSPMEIGWRDISGESIYDIELIANRWVSNEGESGYPKNYRFVGLYYERGIASSSVSNVSQADHLHYGYSIPEPSGIAP